MNLKDKIEGSLAYLVDEMNLDFLFELHSINIRVSQGKQQNKLSLAGLP